MTNKPAKRKEPTAEKTKGTKSTIAIPFTTPEILETTVTTTTTTTAAIKTATTTSGTDTVIWTTTTKSETKTTDLIVSTVPGSTATTTTVTEALSGFGTLDTTVTTDPNLPLIPTVWLPGAKPTAKAVTSGESPIDNPDVTVTDVGNDEALKREKKLMDEMVKTAVIANYARLQYQYRNDPTSTGISPHSLPPQYAKEILELCGDDFNSIFSWHVVRHEPYTSFGGAETRLPQQTEKIIEDTGYLTTTGDYTAASTTDSTIVQQYVPPEAIEIDSPTWPMQREQETETTVIAAATENNNKIATATEEIADTAENVYAGDATEIADETAKALEETAKEEETAAKKAAVTADDPSPTTTATNTGAGTVKLIPELSFAFESSSEEKGEDGAYTFYPVPFKVGYKPTIPASKLQECEDILRECDAHQFNINFVQEEIVRIINTYTPVDDVIIKRVLQYIKAVDSKKLIYRLPIQPS